MLICAVDWLSLLAPSDALFTPSTSFVSPTLTRLAPGKSLPSTPVLIIVKLPVKRSIATFAPGKTFPLIAEIVPKCILNEEICICRSVAASLIFLTSDGEGLTNPSSVACSSGCDL